MIDRDLPLKKVISDNIKRLMKERGWTRRDNNHIPKSIDISMFERHVLLRRAKFVQNYFQLLSRAKRIVEETGLNQSVK